MRKKKPFHDPTPDIHDFPGVPESTFDLVNQYGTYNIQPTSHTENLFPLIGPEAAGALAHHASGKGRSGGLVAEVCGADASGAGANAPAPDALFSCRLCRNMVGWTYTIWYSDPQIHDSEEREAMKQMKRAAGLLLALVLVLSMAACGKKDGDGGDSQSGFQRGTIENGIYTNTFVGIGCQLSDDWTYYTDEQLAELSGVVAESSEEMQKAMEDGKSTYDMFASAMEGLVTINVVYEDLGALYGKLLDEAGYLEIAVPKLEDALTSMGLSNVKVEQTPVQFAGLVREGAVISGEMDGVPMYETLVCIKQEGYMCCVTMCSWTEDITADLVELFYQA